MSSFPPADDDAVARKNNEATRLLLSGRADIKNRPSTYHDHEEEEEEEEEEGHHHLYETETNEEETPLPTMQTTTSTTTNRKYSYFSAPRRILRAISAPLSSRRRRPHGDDRYWGKPIHPLLVREQHVSFEQINPRPDCQSRKSSFGVALFNLVATVCGGGVLSLPLVFARAGILPTTILMIWGAVSTDASLQRLVDAARTTGSRSYGDVSQAAFGKFAQVVTTLTLAIMLVGSLIAYLLLTRDVWAPVLFALTPALQRIFLRILVPGSVAKELQQFQDDEENDGGDYHNNDFRGGFQFIDRRAADLLLLIILVLAMPLMLKRELYALRHTCYIGFGSCVTLGLAVILRAYQRLRYEYSSLHLLWWSRDPTDWLFAFPLVVLCFFCSYNVLPVHSQLSNPTRERMGGVLRYCVLLCFVLFYAVGLGGYICAYPYTPDNIITAFPMDDMYVLAGRMGYCLTLLFGVPLILLPCREAWVSLPSQVRDWKRDRALIAKYQHANEVAASGGDHYIVNGVDFDEPLSFLQKKSSLRYGSTSTIDESDDGFLSLHTDRSVVTDHSLHSIVESEDDEEFTGLLTKQAPVMETKHPDLDESKDVDCECEDNGMGHLMATLILLTVTYATAISVPGVASVWSIFGSSMALFIAFVVPTACYIQIRKHKGLTGKAVFAWTLLIVSITAMILCTSQAVTSAINGTI